MHDHPLSGPPLRDILETVRHTLAAERVLLTQVSHDRQFVLLATGPPLPSHYASEMPLSHSICQHVVGMRFPLKIDDAILHPLLKGSRIVSDLSIRAYLGHPIGADFPSMTLCAVCPEPRVWDRRETEVLAHAAIQARTEYANDLRGLSKLK